VCPDVLSLRYKSCKNGVRKWKDMQKETRKKEILLKRKFLMDCLRHEFRLIIKLENTKMALFFHKV